MSTAAFQATSLHTSAFLPSGRESASTNGTSSGWFTSGFQVLSEIIARPSKSLLSRLAPHRQPLADISLYNAAGLQYVGSRAYRLARNHGKKLSLVLLDFRALTEVQDIYGPQVRHDLMVKIVDELRKAAGRHGTLARTSPTEFAVLAPGYNRHQLTQALHDAMGTACCVEFKVDDEDFVLAPEVLVDDLDPEVDSFSEWVDEMHNVMRTMRENEERRLAFLAHERARHSKPAPLTEDADDDAFVTRGPIPPTMPAPLSWNHPAVAAM